jgi:rhodanese-related sulfurtransferase
VILKEAFMNSVFVDVREYPEYAMEHIEGSRLVPLGTLKRTCVGWDKEVPLILVCRSGRRAEQARQILGFMQLEVLEGGIEAWRSAGKPLAEHPRKPWAIERQVRVVAGSLVLGFVCLGVLASRKFLLGAGLVGAGLIFAGVSDTCMMGSALGRMPWNCPRREKA